MCVHVCVCVRRGLRKNPLTVKCRKHHFHVGGMKNCGYLKGAVAEEMWCQWAGGDGSTRCDPMLSGLLK